uniref:Uncharacterized protein n=1 Tax=Pyrodinium bahamense TaxID=73915 RepID=A0A7S0AEA0_9DINO
MARLLNHDVERLGGALEGQAARVRSMESSLSGAGAGLESYERRARGLEEAAEAVGASLARLGGLLEGQEQRTVELAHAISRASSCIEAQEHRTADCESRAAALPLGGSADDKNEGSAGSGRQDNEPVWQALRELQELVVHESEHRAAGLREVLSVLGQGIEQLRNEQAQSVADIEAKGREEARRAKQRLREAQARHGEQERRQDGLDARLDALAQAMAAERSARAETVAWVEEQIREARASRSPHGTPDFSRSGEATPGGWGSASGLQEPPAAETATRMVTSQSLQRLEALEARYDRNRSRHSDTPTASARVWASPRFSGGSAHSGGGDASWETRPSSTDGSFRRRSELAALAGMEGWNDGGHMTVVSGSNTKSEDSLLHSGSPLGMTRVSAEFGRRRGADESGAAHLGAQQRHGSPPSQPRHPQTMARSFSAPSGLPLLTPSRALEPQALSQRELRVQALRGRPMEVAPRPSRVMPTLMTRVPQAADAGWPHAEEEHRKHGNSAVDAMLMHASTPSFSASIGVHPPRAAEPVQPLPLAFEPVSRQETVQHRGAAGVGVNGYRDGRGDCQSCTPSAAGPGEGSAVPAAAGSEGDRQDAPGGDARGGAEPR